MPLEKLAEVSENLFWSFVWCKILGLCELLQKGNWETGSRYDICDWYLWVAVGHWYLFAEDQHSFHQWHQWVGDKKVRSHPFWDSSKTNPMVYLLRVIRASIGQNHWKFPPALRLRPCEENRAVHVRPRDSTNGWRSDAEDLRNGRCLTESWAASCYFFLVNESQNDKI